MKLTSPVFFPCKKPCYYANLAYRRQKVNLLLIVPRYKANQSVMSFSWCIQLQHPLLQHQLNQAHLLSLHSHFLTTKKSIIITISLADLTSSSICHGVIFLCLIIWGETCSNRRSCCPSLLLSLYNWLTDCYLKSREQYQQYPWR
jgi:hypothetical protein